MRIVLWNVYAIPATVVFVAGGISVLGTYGAVAWADLALSIPLYVALQLHIWTRRVGAPLVWRAYALAFVAWQSCYSLVVMPSITGRSFGMGDVLSIGLQAPMLVALFLYAFRRWPETDASIARPDERCAGCGADLGGAVTCPVCGRSRPRVRRGLLAIGVAVLLLAVVVAGVLGGRAAVTILKDAVAGDGLTSVHEVATPPPASPSVVESGTALSLDERRSLRAMLASRDFEGLTAALEGFEAASESDPEQDVRACEAFGVFNRASDAGLLGEWVDQCPGEYAPLLARAEQRYAAAWNARGSAWARDTSDEQFREMGRLFELSEADAGAALALNPRLVDVYRMRIHIRNAGGAAEEESEAVAAARGKFPHSRAIAGAALHATKPRWGGSYPAMEELCLAMIADNPGDPRFVTLLGAVYADQADLAANRGDHEAAEALYDKALAYGENGEWLAERGWERFLGEDRRGAMEDAERAVTTAPGYVRAYLLRASVRVLYGQTEAARRDSEAARVVDDEDEYLRYWLRTYKGYL